MGAQVILIHTQQDTFRKNSKAHRKTTMKSTSIAAYERPARVASYDADMDVMHPNRHKMVSIALEILPFDPTATITALDLGTGTGFFTAKFLERFPQAECDQRRRIEFDGGSGADPVGLSGSESRFPHRRLPPASKPRSGERAR